MTIPSAMETADYLWSALGLYWLISARQSSSAKTHEPNILRALRFLVLGTVFVLLLSPWLRIGVLGRRFLSDSMPIHAAGLALTVAGILLTVWARVRLGRNWSDKVVIKTDHELIRTGPYAYMRHPIYSGVLLGIAGTALVIGEWRGVAAFCLMLANYWIKARKEERVLKDTFGEAFDEHMRRTGFLLPRFRFGVR